MSRPHLFTTAAALLALALTGGALSAGPASATTPAPVATATLPVLAATPLTGGNDLSWPQCPKRAGGYNLPGPTSSAKFVVVGLSDGGSFKANPCLSGQVASARRRHLLTGAYAMLTYPSAAELARYGGTGTAAVRLGRVGRVEAAFNLATLRRAGLRVPLIWVDVEFRAASPWSSPANNNAVIDGVIAGYQASGVQAGIYSYASAWKVITGSRVLTAVPTWVPAGHRGRAVAASWCRLPSFAGTKPWLTQWTDGVRDYDLTCPGVAAVPARGDRLTRYLKVRLAAGASGSSVAALQSRIGGLVADGHFGPATRARVVAFQRAHHLVASGVVASPVWRALGAGAPYYPAHGGITGSLFART